MLLQETSGADAPFDLVRFSLRLAHTARRIAAGEPPVGRFRILTYSGLPFKAQFSRLLITVLNRGRGGEEAGDELARFQKDVIAEEPALVICRLEPTQFGSTTTSHK
jgi:hypothetical protein